MWGGGDARLARQVASRQQLSVVSGSGVLLGEGNLWKEIERRTTLLLPFFLSHSLLEKPLSFSLTPSTRTQLTIFSLKFSAPASLPSTTRCKILPLSISPSFHPSQEGKVVCRMEGESKGWKKKVRSLAPCVNFYLSVPFVVDFQHLSPTNNTFKSFATC